MSTHSDDSSGWSVKFFDVQFNTLNAGRFTPSSYKFLFAGLEVDPIFSKLWKNKCMTKLKVFAWLFLMDRLNTRGLMLRKH